MFQFGYGKLQILKIILQNKRVQFYCSGLKNSPYKLNN